MKMPVDIWRSVSVLDGSDLVDKAYTGMMALIDMTKAHAHGMIAIQRFAGENVTSSGTKASRLIPVASEFLSGLIHGVYMPGTERDYWCGNFDVGVDDFPERGCVYCKPSEKEGEAFVYVYIKSLGGFAHEVMCQCPQPVARYRVSHVAYKPNGALGDPETKIVTRVSYFAVNLDGSIWTAHDRRKLRDWWGAAWAVDDDRYQAFHWGPGALSLLADRRFLWLVETQEALSDLNAKAKMQFGVDPEMVKSLFYSRTVPMTSSGRLRPILHWVEAHIRRLKAGVDIDIIKHLRGIERFKMGGLDFGITSPVKPVKRGKA